MNDKTTKEGKRPVLLERPYPWRCRNCGKSEVRLAKINHNAEVKHDGRLYSFPVADLELPVCGACGEKVFTENADEQVLTAFRRHLNLLFPEQIRAALDRLGMSQKEAADRLGIAEATLSRWVNAAQFQSRAMDNLMRVFFAFPAVREALNPISHDPSLGTKDLVTVLARVKHADGLDQDTESNTSVHGAKKPLRRGFQPASNSFLRAAIQRPAQGCRFANAIPDDADKIECEV